MKGNPMPVGLKVDPGYRQPIFEATYESESRTADGRYLQPDGTTITDCSGTCSLSFDSVEISGSKSYQDTLSVKASLSLGYTGFGIGAKFSASASFKVVQKTTSSGSNLYTLSSATCCSYKAETHGFNGPPLSENFLTAVKTLTDEYKEDVYFRLIQNFGTHYIMEAQLGSLYGLQSEVSKEAWSELQQKGYSVGTAASVSAYGVTFGASFENSKQKEMSEDFQNSVTSRKAFSIGVKPPMDLKIESWIQETSNAPAPMLLRLNSILDLFDGSHGIKVTKAVKENMRKALEDYCPLLKKQGEVSTCEAPGPDPLKPVSFPDPKKYYNIENTVHSGTRIHGNLGWGPGCTTGWHGADDQMWRFERKGDAYYIYNKHNHNLRLVSASWAKNDFGLYDGQFYSDQKWRLTFVGGNKVRINNFANGYKLGQWKDGECGTGNWAQTDDQIWELKEV